MTLKRWIFASATAAMLSMPAIGLAQTAAPAATDTDALQSPPMIVDMPAQFKSIYSYLLVIEQYARVANTPSAVGIAAVTSANDLLKSQGTDAQISFFTSVLQRTDNDAVRRVIRLQLVDLYKQTNQTDKALDELRNLITETPQ